MPGKLESGGALAGLRVIELGELVSAPYCAKLFADYGADVIKIEPPAGDRARQWGPFPRDTPHPEKSGLFLYLNTNKRGITLDLDTARGREIAIELIRTADVLIENQPPRQARDRGLDHAGLAEINPDLVTISITPFGQTGPYADWHAYDLNAFHMSATGSRYCGQPSRAPLEHGTFSADFFGAVAGASWGLAAVYGRKLIGGGQHLDVSCAEVIAATFVGGMNIAGYARDGQFDRRTGVGMSIRSPATILPCRDGHVWILALEPGQWNGLARVMGDPEWMHLEMFQDLLTRTQHSEAMYRIIESWTREHGKWEIMERCQAAGCPITAVFTVAEAADHPHLRERGYIVEIDHPAAGRIRSLGVPFRLLGCPGRPTRPAPLLGQHNEEVLAEVAGRRVEAPRRTAGTAAFSREPSGDRQAIEAVDERDAIAFPGATPLSHGAGTPDKGSRRDNPLAGRALPLEGIRVANFGWVWAGPVVGQTLAFLGAEVYKIESRVRLDLIRTLTPFDGEGRDPNRSLPNHAVWAGNGSVTLNLRKPEARELARKLALRCDVVVENFSPGVMEKLGLGYEELRTSRPDIVMFSMPAAGLRGPLKDIRTYGLSLTSVTGLDSMTGYVGGPPMPVENAFSDPFNGLLGAFAVLVALADRKRTGEGRHIDYSQQEAVMQMVGPAVMDYFMNGRVRGPLGNRHPLGADAPHGVFRCAGEDRWISIAVTNQKEWEVLVLAMGDPEWARAAEFSSAAERVRHIDALHERIAAWTAGFGDYDLAHLLQRHGVAAAPVATVADLLDDPHYRARRTFIQVDHPLGIRETIYGAYVKTSRTLPRIEPGPRLGRDNDHVFLEMLGLPAERYRQLIEEQAIY